MDRSTETSAGRNLVEEVNYQINSFVHVFTLILYLCGLLAIAGLVMRWYAVTGGTFLFVFAMVLLVLLFMVQIGLSFFYIIANLRLAFLGAVGSFALMLANLALIFRYQNWWGWQFMLFVALPIYFITSFFLGMYLARKRSLRPMQRQFLYRNLVLPYLFMLILAILSFAFDPVAYQEDTRSRGWSSFRQEPRQAQIFP
jgi:hypothetical protein